MCITAYGCGSADDNGDAGGADGVPTTAADPDGESSGADGQQPDSDGAAGGTEGDIDNGDSAAEEAPLAPAFFEPLTGLPATEAEAQALDQRRAMVVKVDNNRRSRPQAGLASADIVFDELIEAAATRFMAVFHTEIPARVGPVRSARTSDLDILSDFARPLFVFSGGNSTVLRQLRAAVREGTLIDTGASRTQEHYVRDRDRPPPFDLYFIHDDSSLEPMLLLEDVGAQAVTPIFEFGPPSSSSQTASSAGSAVGITVDYQRSFGSVVDHIWDPDVQGWVRIQNGELHLLETDAGLVEAAPTNVVVLHVTHRRSAADYESPQAVTYGQGKAWVLTAGRVQEAAWERTEGRPGYRFTDASGAPLTLTPGKTWVIFANTSRSFPVAAVVPIFQPDGDRMLAEARATAAGAAG